jgi:hypothetical protein
MGCSPLFLRASQISQGLSQEEGSVRQVAESTRYRIRIRGHLAPYRLCTFEGLVVSEAPNGDTLITGWIADQAALYGLLNYLRDLGQVLVSLRRLDSGVEDG